MAQDLKVGQFWRDAVIKDLLKIQEFSEYTPDRLPGVSPWKSMRIEHGEVIREPWPEGEKPVEVELKPAEPIRYVRCACYVRGEYFGLQEMKASRLDGVRFQRIEFKGWRGWFKRIWYKWKFRKP